MTLEEKTTVLIVDDEASSPRLLFKHFRTE